MLCSWVRNLVSVLPLVVGCLVGCPQDNGSPDAGEGEGEGEPTRVKLTGAVQKGPFVIGSSLTLSALDESLSPTGAVFNTATINDLGEFDLQLTSAGPMQIEGNGFYYNEVTGALSQGNLTLRAFFVAPATGEARAFVNLITHLTGERIRTLVAGGTLFDEAVGQAEGELVRELAISPPDFQLGRRGIEMNVLGGDDDDNAYLLAASAVLAQAGFDRTPGSADAELQNLINGIALDLASDGLIAGGTKTQLRAALLALDVPGMREAFAGRLQQTGSDATVPDVDRVLDQDGDGHENAEDNCDLHSNADQQNGDGDPRGDACDTCPATACAADCLPAGFSHEDTCVQRCAVDDDCDGAACAAVLWPGEAEPVSLCAPPCFLTDPGCPAGSNCLADGGDFTARLVCAPRPNGEGRSVNGEYCQESPWVCGDGASCVPFNEFDQFACLALCDRDDPLACGGSHCFPFAADPQNDPLGYCAPELSALANCALFEDDRANPPVLLDSCGPGFGCTFSSDCPGGGGPCCHATCVAGLCADDDVCVPPYFETTDGAELCVPPVALGGGCRSGPECGVDAGCFDGADSRNSALPGDCRARCVDDTTCAGTEICVPVALDGVSVCAEVSTQCQNGILDVGEMGIDCGASCPPCASFAPCALSLDCAAPLTCVFGGRQIGFCARPCDNVGDCALDDVCAAVPGESGQQCLPTVGLGARCAVSEQCPMGTACSAGDNQTLGTCQ